MKTRYPTIVRSLLALSLAATATPALADVRSGVEAWSRGHYAAAIAEWRQPAIDGDADAQFNMGQAYKLGMGVPQDDAIAIDWYRRAAEQGHLPAADQVGLLTFQNGRREEAMPYIIASANRGEPRAQYVLGTAYYNGDVVARDPVRAYALMTRANAAGLPQARQSLAAMDRAIPLAERQQAMVLAGELETQAEQARSQAVTRVATAPVAPVAAPSNAPAATSPAQAPMPAPVRVATAPRNPPRAIPTTNIPPSAVPAPATTTAPMRPANTGPVTAGADFANPVPVTTTPRAPATRTPATVAAPARAPVIPPAAPPANPAPARQATAVRPAPAATAATSSGTWRIQLGAFSAQSRAESLWTSLEARHPALAQWQPFLVRNGAITRLQAGNFASKAEADRACQTVASSVAGCLALRP